MDMPKILVVDDEEDLCEILKFNLEIEGYEVDTAFSAEEALKMDIASYQLLLLDVMMGEISGFKMASILKKEEKTADIPIIFLTAKAQAEDRIQGLELGADDYVTKPFSPKELVLRVASVLKRCEHTPGSVIAEYGPFTFDKNALKFYIDNEEVDLTATEFKLMIHMVEREGQTLNRNDLLSCVWGYSHQAQSRTLDTHMKRLRQKLAPYADCIETVRSIGYRFTLPGRRIPEEKA